MWPIMVEIARSRSGWCVSTRTRILVSRRNAINTTAVVWIAIVSTMSERPRLQLERSTRFPYHRPHRQTATTTEVDRGPAGLTLDAAASERRRGCALTGIQWEAPGARVGACLGRYAMGDYGIAGLWLLLALALVASVLVAAGSMWLADRTLTKPVSEGHNGALSPFMTCVSLVYGALLGFTIVVAWEQFSSAETNVSNEASTLTTMYRQTVGMPVPEQSQMRVLLRKYTQAVEGPEWENAIRTGSGTESARDALNEMYRVLGSEQSSVSSSPISQKFLDQLTTLASERNQRILDAKPRIPGLLWTGLLFGGVVLLGLGGFMRLGSVRAHLLLLSAVAVLLGLLLFIVYWLDHPFGNQLGVTSEPFEQSLSVFDSIDRGT
jgi:uncharacterized protein DUF4239